jgi:hypothetical protein
VERRAAAENLVTEDPELWLPSAELRPIEDISFEYEARGARWRFELPAERLLVSPVYAESVSLGVVGCVVYQPEKFRGLRIWAPVSGYRITRVPE